MKKAHAVLFLLGAMTWLAIPGCHGSANDNPDGSANSDGGSPDLAPPYNPCPGIAIRQDSALDVNVRSIHVVGNVTVNKAQLPDVAAGRGSLLFREKNTGTSASASLGTSGTAQYDVELAPGQYDVLYVPGTDLTQCASAANKLPCISGPIATAVTLSNTGALDLDLPAIVVQGSVTVNGAAVPSSYQQAGGLVFQSATGDTVSTADVGTGLRNYRLTVLPGLYQVGFSPRQGCGGGNPLPCISGTLKTGIKLLANSSQNVDIPTLTLQGTVSINGQPVDPGNAGLGAVIFRLSSGDTVSTGDIMPGSGLSSYQVTLLPGVYDVLYDPLNSDCTVTGIPCIGGTLNKGVVLQSSRSLDINVPVVTIQGNVTIDGQPVTSGGGIDGSLVFQNLDSSTVLTAYTGPHELSHYNLTLLSGVYRVDYSPLGSTCSNPGGSRGPCVGGPIKTGLSLSTSTSMDFDIPTLVVSGQITVKGSPVNAQELARGYLQFQVADGGIGTTSDLSPFSIRLLAGVYSISYAFAGSSCQPNESIPCSGGVILQQPIGKSTSLTIDIPMVRVQGKVTLNGMPMPDISQSRGQLDFMLGTADTFTADFGSTGPVTYSVSLLPAAYKVIHATSFTTCSAGTGEVPCVNQVLEGCN